MAEKKIRLGWLKGMYIYTIVGAGGLGLGIILAPDLTKKMLGWPGEDPVVLGVFGSVYAAFALLSIFGLRSPLKFAPVLVLQLFYKLIWSMAVALPLVIEKKFPPHGAMLLAIFATYIIGDLIAIPFSQVFARQTD